MQNILNFIFNSIGDIYVMLGNFYLFPGVSLLHIILTFFVLQILFYLLSFFNIDISLGGNSKNESGVKKGSENVKDKKNQKKNGIYLYLLLLLLPLKVNANSSEYFDISPAYNSNFYNHDYLVFLNNYIINLYNNPDYDFNFVIKRNGSTSEYVMCRTITKNIDNYNFKSSCFYRFNSTPNDITTTPTVINSTYSPSPAMWTIGNNIYFYMPDGLFWSDSTPISGDVDIDYILDMNKDNVLDFFDTHKFGSSFIYKNGNISESYLYRYFGYNLSDTEIPDTIPPTLNLNGSTNYNHEINTIYNDAGYSCIDDSGVCNVEVIGEVDTSQLGTYDIEYKATDPSGNITKKIRKVNIIDTIPPELELIGKSKIYIIINDNYEDLGYIVSDNSLENIEVEIIGEVDTTKLGTYEIEYIACDSSDNCTTKIKTIIITEELPLDFSGSQFLFADFEDIKDIFPNIDFSDFSHNEKIIITLVFNIFMAIFIALVIYVCLNVIHKFLRLFR